MYLSFNYAQITGSLPDGTSLLPLLHIVSGLCGVAAFAVVIAFHHRLERTRHMNALVWVASTVSAFGTLLYTAPLANSSMAYVLTGAVVTGLSTPLLALAWGVAFCRLDAQSATMLTAGSFLVAGVGYELVSLLAAPVAGIVVAFMPFLSAALLYTCGPFDGAAEAGTGNSGGTASHHDFAEMLAHTGTGRVMAGLVATMFVCGGLRIYLMQAQRAVYSDPLLLAVPTSIVAVLFLVYGFRVPHNSLNLGPFYRMAMPLFALAFLLVAMLGPDNSSASFIIMSAAAAIIDMLTWVLLIEVVRSTHFSALLVMATGRLSIHLGMALGELTGLCLLDSMTAFFVVSIVLLMMAMGYMFTDNATTFLFEPPTEEEMHHVEGSPDVHDGESSPEAAEEQEGEAPAEAKPLEQRIDALAETYGLTPRETEVITLWASGYGSKAIEEKLVLSPSTVKTHLRHIYEKCDVHSRADILQMLEDGR